MIERHPFKPFVPKGSRYLLLGSFVVRQAIENVHGCDWYYCNKVNQFWPILEIVYGRKLKSLASKKRLFCGLGLAVTDVILSCERKADNNSDTSLINPVFNIDVVSQILKNNKIERIYFTSKFVENIFKRHFSYPAGVKLVALPSPSPRYARMSFGEKVESYKRILP